MRILFVDQFSDLGGAQRCLLDLLPGMRERGWACHLALPGAGPLWEALRGAGDSLDAIPSRTYESGRKSASDSARFARQVIPQAAAIRALLRRYDADILYVNGPRLLPAAAIAGAGRTVVFHAHSRVPQAAAAWLARCALRASGAFVIASSQFVAEPLRAAVASGRLAIVYNGVPAFQGTKRIENANAPRQPGRIGVIGRIAPEKGQMHFIEAARLMARDRPGAEFVVCGSPLFSDPAYYERVRSAAAGLAIAFLGWRDDIAPVLAGFDALAVPSEAVDATPRVILEAYAAGVPAIAFRNGGLPEIVEHGRTGLLTEPNAPALAHALRSALSDRNRLEQMGAEAHHVWQEKYTVERYRSEVTAILERLCFNRRHSRKPDQSAGTSARA